MGAPHSDHMHSLMGSVVNPFLLHHYPKLKQLSEAAIHSCLYAYLNRENSSYVCWDLTLGDFFWGGEIYCTLSHVHSLNSKLGFLGASIYQEKTPRDWFANSAQQDYSSLFWSLAFCFINSCCNHSFSLGTFPCSKNRQRWDCIISSFHFTEANKLQLIISQISGTTLSGK